jgi:hypothetical protein
MYPDAPASIGYFLKKKPPRKISEWALLLGFCSKPHTKDVHADIARVCRAVASDAAEQANCKPVHAAKAEVSVQAPNA